MNLDKQILEELEKFKLMSSYSPKKTLSENINEQNTYNTAFTPNPLTANKKPAETTKTDDNKVTIPSSCKNSMTYEDLSQKAKIVAEAMKKMDAVFVRMGYGLERAQSIFNIIKEISNKNVFDSVTNKCEKALVKFKELFLSKSSGWFQGGFDIEKKLEEFISGYYKDDSEILRYIKPALEILKGSLSVSDTSNTNSKKPAPKPAPIPKELGDIEGVKKFQDWLDKNHAGWATGFSGGILNKAGGYGRFGPRTSKGWASYGAEYQKSLTGTPSPTNPNDVASLENKFGLKSSADIVADYKKNNANIPNPNGVNPQDMAKK